MDPVEAADLTPGVTVPALGLLEFESVARGIRAGDAMIKKAPVRALVAGSIQPGKYLVLVDGDVASVEEALAAGVEAGAPAVLDRLFLPDVHPAVGNAVAGERRTDPVDTLGVLETRSCAAILRGTDAAMKGAEVSLVEIRLGNGLGGKALALLAGAQPDVEAALEIATGVIEPAHRLEAVLIPRLHEEMADNLLSDTRFAAQWNRSEG